MENNSFEPHEIEDVRIIIKAKGKHWSITPREDKKDEALSDRIAVLIILLSEGHHNIVGTPLEDIKPKHNE